MHASAKFNFHLTISCPKNIDLDRNAIVASNATGGNVVLIHDPEEAANEADCVITDVWVSMGDDKGTRVEDLKPFQVNQTLLDLAQPDALFLHCLPALRGQEVTAEVIDGPQSVVFDEAENRLHAQKAIMAYIFKNNY